MLHEVDEHLSLFDYTDLMMVMTKAISGHRLDTVKINVMVYFPDLL